MSGSEPRPLRDRMDAANGISVRFGPDPSARRVSPDELRDRGRRYFAETASGRTVAAILTNDQASVELVLGAIASGSRLASLPLPPRGGDLDAYVVTLRSALAAVEATEVVCADAVAPLLEGVGLTPRPHSALGSVPVAVPGDAFSLVQFTSGSTGAPRGIVLDETRLDANLEAILGRIRPRPGDVAVSWLPLSHDMGLIGMLLSSIAAGERRFASHGGLVLLDPRDFLGDPRAWTTTMSREAATFSAAPDFGLRLATRRGLAAGTSLDSMRCLIVGGEIVRPATLSAFTAALGCPATAICPAYGMAEVGLAVSIDEPGVPWRAVAVSSAAAAVGELDAPSSDDDRLELAVCGRALDGYEVSIGGAAQPRSVGAVGVRGPSIGRDLSSGAELGEPALETGDLGFVDGAGLCILGRSDDVIVVHGRRVHAPHVEATVGDVDGVRPGRVAATVLPTGRFVVAFEADDRRGVMAGVEERVRRITVAVAGAAPDAIVVLGRGELPMTPSGKLRRTEVAAATGAE